MQIFSDGGFNGTSGAAAFVVVLADPSAANKRCLGGHRGIWIPEALSAFQAELIAADIAVELAREIATLLT